MPSAPSAEILLRELLTENAGLHVPVDGLAVEDDLYAVGMTSHASVSVMLAIEDGFDVAFPDSLLRKSTFGSIASLLDAIAQIEGEPT